MLRSFVINKYIGKEFLKVVLNVTFVLSCVSFVLNLFEEINFFKDYNVGFDLPIIMSLLFVPNLVYNIFPFVILLSGIWFFLKIKKNDEIIAMKSSGMSNLSLITVIGSISLVLGIILVTAINPIISSLVTKYESIKTSYEKERESLASVTVNGIWIKEKRDGNNFIIKSSNLKDKYLINIKIYEFDNNYNFIKRINAERADIENSRWKLENVTYVNAMGEILPFGEGQVYYESFYNFAKIKSIYSNLDTISFWNINNEIKILEERGYSTKEMRTKMQRSFSFPFFLLSMVLLSGVFTLSSNFRESNWNYVFIAIISSVLIFYFNDFSTALGKTDKLTVEVSVWMPIIIIFIFSAIGVLHANQK